jgi:hypothetical protein
MKVPRQLIPPALGLFFLTSACGGYRHPEFLVREPVFYESRASHRDLTVAADPFLDEGEQYMLFHYNARKRGIYPVRVIFFNEGDESYDLGAVKARLLDTEGRVFDPLTQRETKKIVSRSVLVRSAEFGAVGSLGIFFTVPAALWGGLDAYKANRLAGNIYARNALSSGRLGPHEVYQGFLFFAPVRDVKSGKRSDEFRARSYRLELLDTRDSNGGPVNFSLYLPPG